MIYLKALSFCNQEELSLFLDKMNKEAIEFLKSQKEHYLSNCENDNVREVFNNWWRGKRIFNDEYKNRYNKKDWDMANNWIAEAISSGLG